MKGALRESTVVRDVLGIMEKFLGQTIVISVPVLQNHDEIDFVHDDIALLRRLGIEVIVAYQDALSVKHLDPVVSKILLQNQDEIIALATKAGAFKVCFLREGRLVTKAGVSIDDLSVAQAMAIIATNVETPWLEEILNRAVKLCEAGIPRVHIVDTNQHGSFLKELFTWHGSGTLVFAPSANYKEMRPALDVDTLSIVRMLADSDRDRSYYVAHVRQHLPDFWVYAVDGVVNGCARFLFEHQNLQILDMAHSNLHKAGETLQAILKGAREEATKFDCHAVSFKAEDLSPLMAIQPMFGDLGFKKNGLYYSLTL